MQQVTLTLSGVCKYLGIKRRTLYNMIADGRFSVPCISGISPRRWNIEDIDKWRSTLKEVDNI